MNAIIGLSELMPQENLNDLQKHYLNDIKRVSKALLGIINNILDFSKIEAGKMEVVPVHYDVYALFDEIASMCRFIAQGKELKFESYRSPDLPQIVFGDEIRIKQVITNVVNNAVKYTREGYVSFKMLKETNENGKEFILALIEDTGIGIRQEDMSKLFGSFQRLNTNKNRRISGTGLGLAITKQFLDIMDGEIEVESEYKKGSIFKVRLPLIEGDPDKIEKEGVISNFVYARKDVTTNILVADDASVNLTVAKGYLAAHKFEIDTCENGVQALNMVKQKKYDLVFLDHMMPEMDGTEACKNIRALGTEYSKNLPIIALSANAVSGARDLFIESGMNDFISKPIDGVELNRALAKWLPKENIEFGDNKENTTDKHTGDRTAINEILWTHDERSFFRELSGIDGLDPQEGVAHLGGNLKEYTKVLRQLTEDLDEKAQKIKTYLEKEDWENYSILVHAYKGVCSIIGEKALSEQALKLETASKTILDKKQTKNSGINFCKQETPTFLRNIFSFRDNLLKTSLTAKDEKSEIEKTKAELSFTAEKLSQLEKACNAFSPSDANTVAGELKKITVDDKTDEYIKEICKLTDSFRFAEAAEKIKELRAALKIEV
ncbi:hypothetical protein AGMMS50212_13160 [Spirochaetia bacterium]|nr:hypothetical protein AGMMS50212_13160 [Spirochaetia bacterium]